MMANRRKVLLFALYGSYWTKKMEGPLPHELIYASRKTVTVRNFPVSIMARGKVEYEEGKFFMINSKDLIITILSNSGDVCLSQTCFFHNEVKYTLYDLFADNVNFGVAGEVVCEPDSIENLFNKDLLNVPKYEDVAVLPFRGEYPPFCRKLFEDGVPCSKYAIFDFDKGNSASIFRFKNVNFDFSTNCVILPE